MNLTTEQFLSLFYAFRLCCQCVNSKLIDIETIFTTVTLSVHLLRSACVRKGGRFEFSEIPYINKCKHKKLQKNGILKKKNHISVEDQEDIVKSLDIELSDIISENISVEFIDNTVDKISDVLVETVKMHSVKRQFIQTVLQLNIQFQI